MRCYFCNQTQKIIPQKRRLYNGVFVIQCVWCYKTLESGLKLAEERGYYDSNITLLYNRGGETMELEEPQVGTNRLKADFIESRKIVALKILDEGKMMTFSSKNNPNEKSTKPVFEVDYEGKTNDDPNQWALNGKSQKSLMDVWGKETKNWIGKTAEIKLEGTGEYKHIAVDEIRTK